MSKQRLQQNQQQKLSFQQIQFFKLLELSINDLEESINKEITYNGFETGKTIYTINTILITLFNHQTHHRGQIHNMLSQAGFKPPHIDIPDFIT